VPTAQIAPAPPVALTFPSNDCSLLSLRQKALVLRELFIPGENHYGIQIWNGHCRLPETIVFRRPFSPQAFGTRGHGYLFPRRIGVSSPELALSERASRFMQRLHVGDTTTILYERYRLSAMPSGPTKKLLRPHGQLDSRWKCILSPQESR
jgi:hypothetical protein